MFNSFDGTFLISIKEQATDILLQISPVITFVVGILLAFFIIKLLIKIMGGKHNQEEEEEYTDYDNIDDYEGDFDEEEE